jgi:phospholipid/cholesterol/gamma-HCH transport system substrate-binding protein/paraquat-inducible protein B
VGSPVKYRGVQVGKVTEIDFVLSQYTLPSDARDRFAGTVLVRMNIQPRQLLPEVDGDDAYDVLQRRIEAGLRVRVASMSIAGPSYLEADYITGRTTPPPMEIAWTPHSLYLPSGPSTSTQVVSAVERLASQLEHVRIDVLMADLNKLVVNVDTVVQQTDIPTVSKEVTALASELRQTNAQLQASLTDVPSLIGKTQSFMDTANSAMDKAQSVMGDSNLTKVLSESAELATSLRQSADRLNVLLSDARVEHMLDGLATAAQQAGPAATDLRQTIATLQRTLQSAGRDLNTVTTTLRTVATNLDNFAQEARDNPQRLLFGKPPPKTSPGEKR